MSTFMHVRKSCPETMRLNKGWKNVAGNDLRY